MRTVNTLLYIMDSADYFNIFVIDKNGFIRILFKKQTKYRFSRLINSTNVFINIR